MSVKTRVTQLEKNQGSHRCMLVMKQTGESDEEAMTRTIKEQGFTPGPDDVMILVKNFS